MRSAFYFSLCCLAACSGSDCSENLAFSNTILMDRFWKGNTHVHTDRSLDSREPVVNVLRWYRDAGYNFLVVTDHDRSSVPDEFSMLEEVDYLILAGEEISSAAVTQDGEFLPVHVNSICSNGTTVGGIAVSGSDRSLRDAVRRASNIARGIPQINHPNWRGALTAEDILGAGTAPLLEIANQNDIVDNDGNDDHPSVEAKWDAVLSEGMQIYGVASDDTHSLASNSGTRPGRGWVQVHAQLLSSEEICGSLEKGLFYASTGVELERIVVSNAEMEVRISAAPFTTGEDYVTTFIGNGGIVLYTTTGLTPSFSASQYTNYARDPGEAVRTRRPWTHYVRAVIRDSRGNSAWVQPQILSCRTK